MIGSISVVGVGQLGAGSAIPAPNRKFKATGVEINQKTIDRINHGKPPVCEPQIEILLKNNKSRISATSQFSDAVQNTDITFVVVPTPSLSDGQFSNDYVLKACNDIGKAISKKNSYHLIVITSTVMPMSMQSIILPALESSSGKKMRRRVWT